MSLLHGYPYTVLLVISILVTGSVGSALVTVSVVVTGRMVVTGSVVASSDSDG